MTKLAYVIALYLTSFFIFGCIFCNLIKIKNNCIEKPVRQLLLIAAAALMTYASALLLPVKLAADLIFSIYNCFIDAMVVSLLLFVRQFTGLKPWIKREIWIVSGMMTLDWIFMLTNPWTKLVYRTDLGSDNMGAAYYYIAEREPLYAYHLFFVYGSVLLLMIVLVHKLILTPKTYQMKYSTIFISLCVVVALHVTYLNFNFNFDYSLFFYAVTAFAIFYFSLYFVPKGLMKSILFYSVASMKTGIICVDIDGKCIHANKAAALYCQDENNKCNFSAQVQAWFTEFPEMKNEDKIWDYSRTANGETMYYTCEYKQIFDKKQRYIGCFFILHDRTEAHCRLAEEKYRATHDVLTGIYNKEHFARKASERLQEYPDKEFCMVAIDIKNFKLVNDLFGVEMGDIVLKKVAQSIASLASELSIYGRITNDRFCILMPKERFHEEVFVEESAKFNTILDNSVYKLYAHFGVYFITDPTIKISIMCDRAFLAIRSIKDSYQTVVAYYKEALRDSFVSEHKVISEFDHAISDRQFHAFIQPQVTVSGRIFGGEALVRWIHPIEGLVAPYKFIDIFERTGLISRLDPYIWETACMQLRKWHDDGYTDHYISVNISQKDFLLIDVYKTLVDLVQKYRIPPHSLHLEITETSIMNNPKEQIPLISKLRSFGFVIEIDDFGSGYSSLNTLKDLPADVLKIDMGFLSKTDNTERSMTILKMIISLAKALHMEVITEGVETREQVDFLTEFGCDMFQGYYFAKPMQVTDFEIQYLQ